MEMAIVHTSLSISYGNNSLMQSTSYISCKFLGSETDWNH